MQGNISNSGADIGFTKDGTGKLILSGNNTYGGATTVAAGTLLINGTQSGGGLTTVNAGATLGGTGTITGDVANNGTLSPGASVGTLSVTGTVTDGADSHWAIELDGATADKLAVTGSIDLTAMDSLDITGTGTGTSWVIATYTGSETGAFETIPSGYTVDYGSPMNKQVTLMAMAGLSGDFNHDGKVDAGDYVVWRKGGSPNPNSSTDYDLWRANFGSGTPGSGSGLGSNAGAVPEPSSLAVLIIGLVALAGGRRERQTGSWK